MAAKLNVPVASVLRVIAKQGVAPRPSSGPPATPKATPLAGADWKDDGGLSKALEAAGMSTGEGAEAPPRPESANPNLPPPPTPEDLVAMLTAVNGIVCRMAATVWKVKLDKGELESIITLTKEEKGALLMLAPYAADYAPELMSRMKPIMAWTFVGAYLVMSGTRVMDIRGRKPPKLTKAARMAPENEDVE